MPDQTFDFAVDQEVLYQAEPEDEPRRGVVVGIVALSIYPYDVFPGTACQYRRAIRTGAFRDELALSGDQLTAYEPDD